MAKDDKAILVTGGNAGIGFALCKQLVALHDCHVIMGARDVKRGQAAVAELKGAVSADRASAIELVQLDVGDDASVIAAAASVQSMIGDGKSLYGLVNNAGTGLATGAPPEEVVNTNLYGPRRVFEAFVASGLVTQRVVNVGSGSGPGYVSRCSPGVQPTLCKEPAGWNAIEGLLALSGDGATGLGSAADINGGYGISKALLALYTMLCAREHPGVLSSCVSPGWIKTKLVGNSGATKRPDEGTVSIRRGLFESLAGNGWYYGSDAVRSPLHFMRNPGEPAYDGVVDGVVGRNPIREQ